MKCGKKINRAQLAPRISVCLIDHVFDTHILPPHYAFDSIDEDALHGQNVAAFSKI